MSRRPWRPMSRLTPAFLVAGWVFALTFYIGLFRMNYPSRKRFPIQGVDVSHHQGAINWFKAKEGGVQFAYIKAAEGGDFKDSRFVDNWVQCKYADVPWGAYHYFSLCRSGADQARNFLEIVPAGEPKLPPALDLEFGGHCANAPTQAQLAKDVSEFVEAISGRFPGPPVFYATPEFYERYLAGHRREFPPYHLWIRNVFREPIQNPSDPWVFWQYAGRGRMAGIPGSVDLNVFYGNAEQFSGFRKSRSE